jgi:tetratricopeptide (TPR) repeat protein
MLEPWCTLARGCSLAVPRCVTLTVLGGMLCVAAEDEPERHPAMHGNAVGVPEHVMARVDEVTAALTPAITSLRRNLTRLRGDVDVRVRGVEEVIRRFATRHVHIVIIVAVAVAAGIAALQLQSTTLFERADVHDATMSFVKGRVDEASQQLQEQRSHVSSVSSRVDEHDALLLSVEVRVDEVSSRMDDHEDRHAETVTRIDAMEQRHVSGPVPFPIDVLSRPSVPTTATAVNSESSRAPHEFVGRDTQLAELRAAFERAAEGGMGCRHAIVGLGGVGKTILVKEYVRRYGSSYPRGVLWFSAGSLSSLYGGYREVLSQLKLFDGTPDDGVDSDETAMHRVHAWLKRNSGWLLVLDSADEPEMLPALVPVIVGSHMLVTTRARGDRLSHFGIERASSGGDWRSGTDVMWLRPLSTSDCLATMCHPRWPGDCDGGDAVAWLREDFNALPLPGPSPPYGCRAYGLGLGDSADGRCGHSELATNVTAWLASCGLSSFEVILRSELGVAAVHDVGALEWIDVACLRGGFSPDDRCHLWSAVEQQIENQRRVRDFSRIAGAVIHIEGGIGHMAMTVLTVIGALDRGSGVPAWVLLHVCANIDLDALQDFLWPRASDLDDVVTKTPLDDTVSVGSLRALRNLVGVLEQNSFVNVSDVDASTECSGDVIDAGSFFVVTPSHSLVGALALMDATNRGLWGAVVRGSVRGVLAGALRDYFTLSESNEELPRCDAVWSIVTATVQLMDAVGDDSRVNGDSDWLSTIHDDLMDDVAADTGTDSHHWLRVALYLEFRGLHDAALVLQQEVWAAYSLHYGDTSHHSMAGLHNIANALKSRGKYAEAQALYEQALAGARASLPESHPLVLTCMDSIGSVLNDLNKFGDALALFTKVLAGRRSALGDAHPHTLTTMHKMGSALHGQGKDAEALVLYEQVLSGRRSALGDAHPDTLRTMANIANVLDDQGMYADALALYEKVLAGRRSVFGDAHHETLSTLSSVACVLVSQEKYAEAMVLFEQVLAGYRSTLGDAHPDTLSILHNMAVVLGNQGKRADALKLYEKVLDIRRLTLGDAHPHTLSTVSNMGIQFAKQRMHAKALVMFEQVLPYYRAAFGDTHRQTLSCGYRLVTALTGLERYAEALLHTQEMLKVLRSSSTSHSKDIAICENVRAYLVPLARGHAT